MKEQIMAQISTLTALTDSTANLSDHVMAHWLNLQLHHLQCPCQISPFTGSPIGTGMLTHCSVPLTLHVSTMHQKNITFYVTNSPKHPPILGLLNAAPQSTNIIIRNSTTSTESPESDSPVHIPEKYEEFKNFFSKTKASGLPSHHPCNCAITLLPGTSPICGQCMEDYIQKALQQGYIWTATSPTSAECFFVEKRGCTAHMDWLPELKSNYSEI